jgi:hypothetical protein
MSESDQWRKATQIEWFNSKIQNRKSPIGKWPDDPMKGGLLQQPLLLLKVKVSSYTVFAGSAKLHGI